MDGIQIVINVTPQGGVSVSGLLSNELLMMGIMAFATREVANHFEKQRTQGGNLIQIPQMKIVD